MTMTFQQLVEQAKRTAVMQGRAFTSPGDDWAMTVLIVHPGDTRAHVVRIPGWVSNDGDAKEAFGLAMGMAARVTKPLMAAIIQSTWMVDIEDDPEELTNRHIDKTYDTPRLPPSQHPNRRERLFILALDTEVEHAHYADIHRRKRRPPVLGPWESITEGQAMGRIVDPLREALR